MLDALRMASALIKVRVLKKHVPLFLSWNITFLCNLRCTYCGSCEVGPAELNTEQVKEGLDAAWSMGTRWITFGGGEPLVRRDIGEVVDYARKKGFHVFMSTNGVLVPKKREICERLEHVNISIDGHEAVHDTVRGKGSFKKAVGAIDLLKEMGVPVSLQCVVSSINTGHIEEAVEVARDAGVSIMFQPATASLNSSDNPNPITPEPGVYRAAMDKVIAMKREGAPIRNSLAGLRHLRHWPKPTFPPMCVAGRGISIIEADGSVLGCHRCQFEGVGAEPPLDGKIRERFETMRVPRGCGQCWCAPLVELALIFSLRPEPILNAMRMP